MICSNVSEKVVFRSEQSRSTGKEMHNKRISTICLAKRAASQQVRANAILIFLFFILFSATTFATSIAVSPNVIELTAKEQELSFILLNPNNEKAEYQITTSSDKITIKENSGILNSNEKKEIKFLSKNLEKEEYLMISFNSENTINPSISIKLIPKYTTSSQITNLPAISKKQESTINEEEENEITTNAILEQNTQKSTANNNYFDNETILLLVSIIILIGLILFQKTSKQKYPIGHTRQKLRMFIKKFAH